MIWGVVRGGVQVIINVFKWLYDVLVGHSIIPDLVDRILAIFTSLFNFVKPIFDGIASVIVFVWENVVQPAFVAIGWTIENVVIPAIKLIAEIFAEVFPVAVTILEGAWAIIKAVFNALRSFVVNILVPMFKVFLSVVSSVWDGVKNAISIAWGIIKGIWTAIKTVIDTVLRPAFNAIKNTVKTVWDGIHTSISTVWNKIKPIFEKIRDFLNTTLTNAFNGIKDTVTKAWDKVKEATDTVFGKIKGIMGGAIKGGIEVINTLIKGLNKVADILPGVDWNISLIPVPAYASGGPMGRTKPTATKVGNGFVTNRPRAIVGEGSPLHSEYVIATDPKYRARSLMLWQQLGAKLGVLGSNPSASRLGKYRSAAPTHFNEAGVPLAFMGVSIPSPGDVVNAVKGAGEWAAGQVREKAVMGAFAPFNKLADEAIKLIPWTQVRQILTTVKNDIYNWAKGTDDGLNLELSRLVDAVNTRANAGVNMNINEDFKRSYGGYNAELGSPFTVVSALRTYAQQVALYNKYLAGTGNLAAKPGTSRHESGFALDHSPGTQGKAAKYINVAKKWNLHYPVPGEDWHVEPIKRYFEGGLLELAENMRAAVGQQKIGNSVFRSNMRSVNLMNREAVDASLANGGRIVHRPGGALLQVAEGRHDEAVQILPLKDDHMGGDTYIFNGNLEFPNITDPDDAEKFIENLKKLTD